MLCVKMLIGIQIIKNLIVFHEFYHTAYIKRSIVLKYVIFSFKIIYGNLIYSIWYV